MVIQRQQEFANTLGPLLLAIYDHGKLRYVGKVGTGFTRESLAKLFEIFQPLVTKSIPVANPPKEKHITYVIPKLIAQIAFEELTADCKLRQPVFLGLRDDKRARDVMLSGSRRNR